LKEQNVNTTCDPVTSEGKRPTNRAVVAAMFRSRVYGFKGNALTSVTATMKRTAATAITGGLLVASTAGMTVAVSFAPLPVAQRALPATPAGKLV
jgi:hypothetical protein